MMIVASDFPNKNALCSGNTVISTIVFLIKEEQTRVFRDLPNWASFYY